MQLGRITASLLAILLLASSCLASSCAARCERSSASPACHTGTKHHQHSMDANMANMESIAAHTTSASSVSTAVLDLCRHHICAQQQIATNAERNTNTALVSASSALPEAASPLPAFRPRIPQPETPPPGTLLPPTLHTILRV